MDIFEYGNSEANIVLIQPLPGHQNSLMESELALIRKDCCADVRMIAIKVDDWNGALSPWEAPAISGG